MISGWDIYLISRLNDIQFLSGLLGYFNILGFVILLVCTIVKKYEYLETNYEEYKEKYLRQYKNFKKRTILCFIPAFLLVSLAVLTPSTKEAIAIWALPKIVNNEQAQQIPENFAKLINDKLQEWMKDVDLIKDKIEDKKEK